MSNKNPSLKTFMKAVGQKPYSEKIDSICGIVHETVSRGCLGFYAYSDKYTNHDRIIIGNMRDVINWCITHGVNINSQWLFTNLPLPAHDLADMVSADILGAKLVISIAKTLEAAASIYNGDDNTVSKVVLDNSLHKIVEKYLDDSIVFATAPRLEGRLKRYTADTWFRNWTSTNAFIKPEWGRAAEQKPTKPEAAQKLPMFAQVWREGGCDPFHIGYVGTVEFVDGTDEEDLPQIIRKEYGAGEYKAQICQGEKDVFKTGSLRTVKVVHITVIGNAIVSQEPPKAKKPHIMLPPTEKAPLNPGTLQEKECEEKPEPDVFSTAVTGGLFKKNIEEP